MKVLELFSGTESFSKVAREQGYEVFTVDIDPKFSPSLVKDVMQLSAMEILDRFGHPDIIWASPPCQKFSVMQISKNWSKGENGKVIPKSEGARQAQEIVKKTLQLIEELKPTYWFIENPRGMLRKQDFMPNDKRKTVTYCKYGFEYQKATDIWTNCEAWQPKEMCKANSPCHVRAPRGSRTGVQGTDGYRKNRQQKHPIDVSQYNGKRRNGGISKTGHLDFITKPNWDNKGQITRGMIPSELCKELLNATETRII
jgi:hypothetical protein